MGKRARKTRKGLKWTTKEDNSEQRLGSLEIDDSQRDRNIMASMHLVAELVIFSLRTTE